MHIVSWLKWLCAVSLILLMQGPATLVQEVAWAQMLVNYTLQKGLIRGVVETFDGKHPCKMCAKAAELRESDSKSDPKNQPKQTRSIHLAWGDMVGTPMLVIPDDPGTDASLQAAAPPYDKPGRDEDAPLVPPPRQA